MWQPRGARRRCGRARPDARDPTEVERLMRIHRTVRLAVTAAAVAVTALSMVAVPALAGTRATTGDRYLAADTVLNKAATIGGAGSTFAAPLQNAAQAAFMARAQNATINGYQAVGSGTGESDILKKVVDWGGTDVPTSIKRSLPATTSGHQRFSRSRLLWAVSRSRTTLPA